MDSLGKLILLFLIPLTSFYRDWPYSKNKVETNLKKVELE